MIFTNVTLAGGPNDFFIFQIAGTLLQPNATRVTLTGGAKAKNIFWPVADVVAIGTTAHFEGIVLAEAMVAANTCASVNGRLLAQTAVTLQMNTVTRSAKQAAHCSAGIREKPVRVCLVPAICGIVGWISGACFNATKFVRSVTQPKQGYSLAVQSNIAGQSKAVK